MSDNVVHRGVTHTVRPNTATRLRWATLEKGLAERVDLLEEEASKLALLLEMASTLSTERELDAVMKLIADHTTLIMCCDRTSVFLLDAEKDELYALIAQGLDVKELRFSASRGIAGAVAKSGLGLNVKDAYLDPRFNPQVDKDTGYKTQSILCMPLHDQKGRLLGVIQCLNKRVSGMGTGPFNDKDEVVLSAVAAQAAVYLDNSALRLRMDVLFESFVEATSRSIDDRDPCTSGHSQRVMQYSLNLARAVHECRTPPFDRIGYTRDRIRQLRYACLLHDVGKIGVREYILCKATKLSISRMDAVKAGLDLVRERSRATGLEHSARDREAGAQYFRDMHEPLCARLDAAWKDIERANSSGYMSDADVARLEEIHAEGWINETELANLAIRRGNLTEAEWEDMRSHVTKSYRMLVQIPWPPELKDLPEVAYTHHEKWDGSGYPRKLKAEEIHFDGQIMCVADIYDALTASDRPYKKAIPHERAMRILMEEEANKGRLLPELVKLFFEKECYLIGRDAPRSGQYAAVATPKI
jgi:HD-GYP domain-containing protein (c-di-GMP phosphodiesterase class II)